LTFEEFFDKATGFGPFPYQISLANADLSRLALAAPTGAGKTAAAVLAWLWQRRKAPDETPRRLILCEPQRTLVEQVYNEIQKWLSNLELLAEENDNGLVRAQPDKVALHALQGGYIDEQWELFPEQPAVIVGTQDQLLSRALNRGYAMSRFRWPVHFGLFHNDVQWVYDEIQLMGPGLTTSAQLHGLRQKLGTQEKARSLWMSATLNLDWLQTVDHPTDSRQPLGIHPFTEDDKKHADMAVRLKANKPLTKLALGLESNGSKETGAYLKTLANEVLELHKPGRFTLVIVNTVDRAKELYRELKKAKSVNPNHLHLLHSRFRPTERKATLEKVLKENTERLLVSTQVVEAGVDFSADVLVTELAPRSSLIQRFGRCNRRGNQNDTAHVYWSDLKGKACLPYTEPELDAARSAFEAMSSVEPAQFPDRVNEPWPIYDTLRRRDLLELFDTTCDLSGLTLDVGRFIRDGEERDCFLFWREVQYDVPSLDLPAPQDHELCKVKLAELSTALKKGKDVWILDDLDRRENQGIWRKVTRSDIAPGRTFLVKCSDGLYDPDLGFDSGTTSPVKEVRDGKYRPNPFPRMSGDPYSVRSGEDVHRYLTLWDHTKDVCDEVEDLIRAFPGLPNGLQEVLRESALWHDVGKAHDVFQQTMLHEKPDDISDLELWAKRIGSAYHNRRYFRHELASALAAIQNDQPFLLCYLVAAHHGKARISIRAFPEETDARILGLQDGDSLHPINFPKLKLEKTRISLDPFRLGQHSWEDRCLALMEEHGPFRLAYLESLLRAADVRASIKAKKEALV